MPVITLGRRSFSGPYLSPLWLPAKGAGIYAVMVPGWRLLTFRALHFGRTGDFSAPGLLKGHARYAEWLRIAGTDWNLYVATHEMSFSTEAQRESAQRELDRDYRPEFHAPVATAETPSLRTMLLAQAMRMNRPE
ncbi:MAG: hypothetical protein ACREUN_15305 [Burkholderiales bacterium]